MTTTTKPRSRVEVLRVDASHPEIWVTPVDVWVIGHGQVAMYLANDREIGDIITALGDPEYQLDVLTELLIWDPPNEGDWPS